MPEHKKLIQLYGKAIIVLIAIAPALAGSRFIYGAQWKGKTTTADGIKRIENPKEPALGDFAFDLEETSRIGSGAQPAARFRGNLIVDADTEGHVYVLEGAAKRLIKFGSDGRVSKTLGEKEAGLDKFRNLYGFILDGENRPCLIKENGFLVFSKDLAFERRVDLSSLIESVSGAGPDRWIALTARGTSAGIDREVVMIDLKGEIQKKFLSQSTAKFRIKAAVNIGGNLFSPRLVFAPWAGGSAVYGVSSEYKLYFIDGRGNMSLIATKDESPDPITEEEKKEFLKNEYKIHRGNPRADPNNLPTMEDIEKAYVIPSHRPFYFDMTTDDLGNVYVFRLPPSDPRSRKRMEIDIFNGRGIFLFRSSLPFYPLRIKNGIVYAQGWDSGSKRSYIRRYKVRNWATLKEASIRSFSSGR